MQILIIDGTDVRRKGTRSSFVDIPEVQVFTASFKVEKVGEKRITVPNILNKADMPIVASVLDNSGIVLRHFGDPEPLSSLCGSLTVYYGGGGAEDSRYIGGKCRKDIRHERIWRPVVSAQNTLSIAEATRLVQWVKEGLPEEKKPVFLSPPATVPLSLSLNILCQGYLSVWDAAQNGKVRSEAVAKALHVMKWDALPGDIKKVVNTDLPKKLKAIQDPAWWDVSKDNWQTFLSRLATEWGAVSVDGKVPPEFPLGMKVFIEKLAIKNIVDPDVVANGYLELNSKLESCRPS